jgi:glycosyltransferase involved in cell wall biosynthesis
LPNLLVISQACFTAINRSVYRELTKQGWTVDLVVPKILNFPSGVRKADPGLPGDPPIHFLPLKGENPRIYRFEGLISLLDEKRPGTVLLDNDPVSRIALTVGQWCTENHSKLFCISCENLSLSVNNTIRRRGWKALPAAIFKRILLKRTKKVVDGIFTLNNDGKRIFTKERFKRVEQMPLGFDPEYFFPDDNERERLRKKLGLQKTVFAYFGRLIPEKGIHILIKALEKLKIYDWQLMMDEFDEYASDYNGEINRLLITSGIMDRVIHVRPDHFQIGGYMNAADIILVPSIAVPNWKEQYGRVAAEAMACGKLVVASDSGSLPELLGNHGLLFKEGHTDDLAGILEKILTNGLKDYPEPGKIASYAKKELSLTKQTQIMKAAFEASRQD